MEVLASPRSFLCLRPPPHRRLRRWPLGRSVSPCFLAGAARSLRILYGGGAFLVFLSWGRLKTAGDDCYCNMCYSILHRKGNRAKHTCTQISTADKKKASALATSLGVPLAPAPSAAGLKKPTSELGVGSSLERLKGPWFAMYSDFDIIWSFLRSLPPTPSPQCRVAWSASHCSMLCADWRAVGAVGSKLGLQAGALHPGPIDAEGAEAPAAGGRKPCGQRLHRADRHAGAAEGRQAAAPAAQGDLRELHWRPCLDGRRRRQGGCRGARLRTATSIFWTISRAFAQRHARPRAPCGVLY